MGGGPRVAIVGDGIVGWATAFELARRGAVVALYGAGFLGPATGASAGILAPYVEGHGADRLLALGARGLGVYDEFVAQLRAATDVPFEYRRSGTLEVAENVKKGADLASRLGASWAGEAELRWLDASALRTVAPYVSADAVGALLCPAHGYVAVPGFVAALAEAAQRSGVDHRAARADRVECGEEGVVVASGARNESFDYVALCAGAWTPGIDPFDTTTSQIRPVRGQLVRLASPLGLRSIVWGASCYIVPWQDGTVLVGATTEEAGFDVRATAAGVGGLLAAAAALVPELASATFVDVRVGLRPASASGLPILGPGRDPRVVYATGHFRNGILLAPLTARLVATYVLDGVMDPAF